MKSSRSQAPNVIYQKSHSTNNVVVSPATTTVGSKTKSKYAVVGNGGQHLGRYSSLETARKAGRLGRKIDEDESDDQKDEATPSKTNVIYHKRSKKIKDALGIVVSRATKSTSKRKKSSSSKKTKKSRKTRKKTVRK